MELTLAIETSCDDTCAAVMDGERPLSNVIASQGVHDAYGGVVPELAARQHVEAIGPVIAQALRDAGTSADDITRVAVTRGPGLVGSLLIGLQSAKAFALPRGLPLVAVDHMHGHLAATRLAERPPEGPHLALIASGGHTLLLRVEGPRIADATVLGRTLDDAAGEAIDKGARMLGLGYPGGPVLERAAVGGDPDAYPLPIGEKMRGLDFSFAGMKTALLYLLRDLPDGEQEAHGADLAASLQHAVAEALALRVKRAVASTGLDQLALGGGVAANSLLRSRLTELGVQLAVPAREYCTDNAAMIGVAACFTEPTPFPDHLRLDAFGNGSGSAPMIRLYGRPGCHLCEEALAELQPIAARHGAVIEEVNIDLDDALLLQMLERIPVIEVAGEEVCELWVDAPAVTAALTAASAKAQPS